MLRKQYVRSCRQTEESLQEPERGSSCFDLPYAAQESQLHVIRYRFDGIDQFRWSKLLQPEESIFERPSRTKKFARFKKPSRFFTRWWSSLIFLSWNLYEHSSRRTKSPKHEVARSHFLFHLSGCPSTSTSPAYRRFLARSLKIRDAIARTKWYGSETKRNKNMKIRWKSSKKLGKNICFVKREKTAFICMPKEFIRRHDSSQRAHSELLAIEE